MILLKLFGLFCLIGVLTYGGGYSTIPLIENYMINQLGAITSEELSLAVSVSEMTPGPFSINCATYVGMKIAGVPGAVIATLGFIFPSLIIMLTLAVLYQKLIKKNFGQNLFSILNSCVIAVLACSALMLIKSSVFADSSLGFAFNNIDIRSVLLFAAQFIAVFRFRLNPVIVILSSAAIGAVLYAF